MNKVQFVYKGIRLSWDNKKKFHAVLVNGEEMLFEKFKNFIVGGIYEFDGEVSENGIKGNFNNPTFKGSVEHNSELLLQHKAAVDLWAALNQAKKQNDLLELLRPLREAYQATNPQGQIAMEVRLLNYLRNGRDL